MKLSDELKEGLACKSTNHLHSVPARAACIASHPGRILLHPFRRHYAKHYAGKVKNPRLVFGLDLFVSGLVVGLLAVGIGFSLYKPSAFGDKIIFTASVAPQNVVTGDSSTLLIHYANNTGDDLNNVQLSLGFPAHFLLQDLSTDLANPSGRNTFSLGTVKAGAGGNIKIRGVMFGDVGGKQTFTSNMTFTHGKNNQPDVKIDFETFSPTSSALSMSLSVPKTLYDDETITGTVTYQNNGPVDFPDVSLQPVWPAGFTLQSSSAPLKNGAGDLPALASGASGTWSFTGTIGNASTITFLFHPSFSFADATYQQDALTFSSPVAASPLSLSHSIDEIRPGGTSTVTVSYQNISQYPIKNAIIGLETNSPLFAKTLYTVDATKFPALASIAPGASGTITLNVPVLNSIEQSDLSTNGSFTVTSHAYASFQLMDVTGPIQLVTRGADISTAPVTPFLFSATAHYTAPTGDQIGLGPLPPVVGQMTTYWIFWTVHGTINPISNLTIEATLPAGIEFTGRQTVSQGNGVTYDPATQKVTWTLSSAGATLPTGDKAIGAAFELGLTPSPSQVGSAPTILTNISATATDATTGANLISSSKDVTTNLPDDPMAAGASTVSQ